MVLTSLCFMEWDGYFKENNPTDHGARGPFGRTSPPCVARRGAPPPAVRRVEPLAQFLVSFARVAVYFTE